MVQLTRLSHWLLFSLSLTACMAEHSPEETKLRQKKQFSLFSVVTFPNDQCTGKSSSSSDEIKGTCFTSSECSGKSGTADGNCAAGFGVCCTFSVSTCGSTVSENCTYIKNPGYPSTYSTSGTCSYSVTPINTDICQLRLDLDNFDITEGTTGTCTDSFGVSVGSERVYKDLCGTLSGQHIYLETARKTASQTLSFTIATGGTWRMKVSQIECWNTNKAPTDCYQYYTGISGTVSSLNWPTVMLDDLSYTLCVRQEIGYCAIQWSPSASTSPDPFQVGDDTGDAYADDDALEEDAFIEILGSMHVTYSGEQLGDDGTTIAANRDEVSGAILAANMPFTITVTVPTADSTSLGFNLVWRQAPCGGTRGRQ